MTSSERLAWVELLVSVSTAVAMGVAAIWFGHKATGAFALFALLPFLAALVWRRSEGVASDERDRAIHDRATLAGVGWAWQALFLAVIGLHQWAVYTGEAIPLAWMTWVIMGQFILCYAVKGAVAIAAYRGQSVGRGQAHAA